MRKEEPAIILSSLNHEPSAPLAVDDSTLSWGQPDLTSPLPTHTPTSTLAWGTSTPPCSSTLFAPSSPLFPWNVETYPTHHETDLIFYPDTMMERWFGMGPGNHTGPLTVVVATPETGHRAEAGAH